MISSGDFYYKEQELAQLSSKRKLLFSSKETLYEIGNVKKGLQALYVSYG